MKKDKGAPAVAQNGASGDNSSTATVDRCELHDKALKKNPNYDPNNMEQNPNNAEMPYAKQYNLPSCCKVCSKVYAIQAKAMK